MKVLIVDDTPSIRERLAERLGEIAGIEIVGEAGDGEQAMEAIKRAVPHFLTLDIHMPAVNGLALLEQLQSMEPAPFVAIVTNYATEEYRRRCEELGARGFFEKSSQIDDLVSLVTRLRDRIEPSEPAA